MTQRHPSRTVRARRERLAEVDVRVTPGASTQAVFERIDAGLGANPDVSIAEVSIQDDSDTDPAAPFVDRVVKGGQEVGIITRSCCGNVSKTCFTVRLSNSFRLSWT